MTAERRSAESATRQILPALKAVLDSAGIPNHARILQLGAAGGSLLSPVLGSVDGHVFLIDPEARDDPPRISRGGGDPFSAELPPDIDLCIAMPGLVRMPDMVEGLLYDAIHPALRDGGVVALYFPRDATDRTLIAQGATAVRVRTALQSFLQAHFGAHVIEEPQQIRAKFEHCPYFECVGVATRGKGSFRDESIVWLVLKRRAGSAPRRAARQARAFARSRRPDQFSLEEWGEFINRLKRAKIAFLPVDEFAKRYAHYCALDAKARLKFDHPCGHLKFDIHGNVRRALEMALVLRRLKVPGLFLMMHRHPLNQEIFDAPSTWQTLREIQRMGHEIGIHADPFYLIRERGNLHRGLEEVLEDLRGRGLKIRTATLHGDTRDHIKARQLQANDFFRERYRKSKWDGLPPEGEEELARHTYRYSHWRIAKQFGVEYFSEVNFLKMGKLVTDERMLYVSDNARAIRISSIPKTIAPTEQFTAPAPFVIDRAFTKQAADILRQRPFLALFHPQWYW